MTAITPNDFASAVDRQPTEKIDTGPVKTWVVLPAYNEQQGLGKLLTKIQRVMAKDQAEYEVVVVDDASTDQTARVASQASFHIPVKLVQHQQNQGLSGALRTGFETVLGAGKAGDIIVTLDADDTQQPETIRRLLQLIGDGYDVAIASRYQIGSRVIGVPANRVLMTWLARHLFRMIIPIKGVRDYTCGFRAYRFEALQTTANHYGDTFVSEPGFSCMVDVLLKMRKFDFVMGEVPMLLRYDQKDGPSKMQVRRTALDTIRLLLRRRFGK